LFLELPEGTEGVEKAWRLFKQIPTSGDFATWDRSHVVKMFEMSSAKIEQEWVPRGGSEV